MTAEGDPPADDATPQEVVLGEDRLPLSKNALKKQLKAEKAAKAKAEKEAAKAANPKKENEEEITDPNLFTENRKAAIIQMEKAGINPYPHKFHVDYRIPDFNSEFESKIENGAKLEETTVALAGRVVSIRRQGKLYFNDLNRKLIKKSIKN